MDVLARLDAARARTDVLLHPFYQRWSAGELSAAELACYAAQYRHAVVALAEASERAAAQASAEHRAALARHAGEERAHVALWDRFAAACGAPRGAEPLAGTSECAESWTAGEDVLERVAVLYAIEAAQPAISTAKLQGLREHYGYIEEGPATEYFSVHATRDIEHAAEARALLLELLARDTRPQRGEALVGRAEAALRGNWRLLDAVRGTTA